MRALDIGATGMAAQNLNVEVIANNIANVSTTGTSVSAPNSRICYIRRWSALARNPPMSERSSPSGIQLGAGVKAGAIYRINEQGNIQQTSNQLDLAINGSGYFEVELPGWRNGLHSRRLLPAEPERPDCDGRRVPG